MTESWTGIQYCVLLKPRRHDTKLKLNQENKLKVWKGEQKITYHNLISHKHRREDSVHDRKV